MTFQWTSPATQTATVDASGLVTGRATGTVSISASVGPVSGSAAVTVTPAPVATVTVSPPTANVNLTQTVQLTATLRDAAGTVLPLTGRVVTWSTGNSLIATVNSSGLVSTFLLKGPVTITATSEGKTGTSTVTVQ
jgi:uncharacterized protein YjdB